MLSKHIEIPDSAVVGKFIFSKTVVDLDLLKHDSVKELFNYINREDVEIDEVRFLIRKANVKLRIYDKQLFIRKSHNEEAKSRICVTRR